MIKRILFLLSIVIIISCSGDDHSNRHVTEETQKFYKGMDLSFQSELDSYNIQYKDQNNNAIDLLDYVTSKGSNLIRLRLWHTPEGGFNSLEKVKQYALKIKSTGADFLLDIHYSDTWADPANQEPPLFWSTLTNSEIKNAIYEYTKKVISELKEQGTTPTIVQIGNETNSGFLWDYGKIWNEFDNNWLQYIALSNTAEKAVKEIDPNIKTMIHVAGINFARFFFKKFEESGGNYDIIGLSYYPQFHSKNLNQIKNDLSFLAVTFNKNILLTEISYPFTFNWNDNLNNFIGDQSQILNEFPATPDGQKDYLEWIIKTLKEIPNNKGLGFCYWAPDWVAFEGNENTYSNGSSWENQCIFDFEHKVLKVIEVFSSD
ncbi:glycosyl hydrolase 53 family protein [uncultured Aquimarina sp.]|uniref:glycoside hydrolase family 53 protein n=1 Tax=uncultured Aquimarina sp. TaxID=575652 RepID=UPI00260635B8|nr:glycosyl hydrolase 53 family protein [uncultured Aquimarina sp.]